MQKKFKTLFYVIFTIIVSLFIITDEALAVTEEQKEIELEQASKHFKNGEFKEAIIIFDKILQITPEDTKTLNLKAIALSNLDYDRKSLKEFYKVLEHNPKNITALIGMGLGFGNLGEYDEASIYLNKALKERPDSIVINNYKKIIDQINERYRYVPTEKPTGHMEMQEGTVPEWMKNIVMLWTLEKITDNEFLGVLEFLIEDKIIQVPKNQIFEKDGELKMLSWIKTNLDLWSNDNISDNEFFKSVNWLKENKFIKNKKQIQKSQEMIEYERYWFDRYLLDISSNISKEKRFIEKPNPSEDVIKKFLRDYNTWNFEEQVKSASTEFPDPTYEVIDDTYVIKYIIFINNQPDGLPLNHIETLQNTFEFWEKYELKTNQKDAKVIFEVTKLKHEANVWITWVVRDMGEGVLGHAHLGKGVVEVALGDYTCDGSFQLYDVKSVETIMTHEIGHSIGLGHTNDRTNIMYPSYTPSYAYCLLK